jgi:hypothetical protein
MLSHSSFADGAGISSIDVDLLDRLRVMQERLDRLLEPVHRGQWPGGSAVDAGGDTDLKGASRTSIWRVTAGRIGRRPGRSRAGAHRELLSPPAAGTGGVPVTRAGTTTPLHESSRDAAALAGADATCERLSRARQVKGFSNAVRGRTQG